ncbi:EmrB/QacA family drug resistance transporter [Mycolicibacterium aurum]|uniref:EmrB/QacA family drug resistance transporter n=2 Tax=Mycolicibacterium aurum TaxID=1791 RepID=A0A448IUK5_MYCAU|nr:EmrB/QacA family drug resistance transporter [Mycolicibacterium aurum]
MMIGFFLTVVDSSILPVVNPVIRQEFGIDYNAVIWVTSIYLLTFATVLPVGGRLGDRFGPKNMYMFGLALFTAASVWCGLSDSLEALIAARAIQGVGAALLAPQTFSVITRIFPPERRGVPMSLWGAVAGAGMLIGPLAGGVLADQLGWQWVFLVNAPIGVLGLVLAVRFIPALPGRPHHLDMFGVLLSGVGICLIVFGLQEGQHHGWEPWSLAAIAAGVVTIPMFVVWQAVERQQPLIPLTLFRHRNFTLANAGIAVVSFAFVAFAAPMMFYLQEARGLSPTRAALMLAPLAIATGILAPLVGRVVDRVPPRPIIGIGFATLAVGLFWLAVEMSLDAPVWRLAMPLTVMGVAGAFTWEPLAVIASRPLPSELAGAGSAVFNTARQLGALLSSAGIAPLMTWLVSREGANVTAAMSRSMLLPAFAAGVGLITALFLVGPEHLRGAATSRRRLRATASVAL